MSAHPPIGACCYRPSFNAVGGVDDFGSTPNLQGSRAGVRKLKIAFAVAGMLATLAFAWARSRL